MAATVKATKKTTSRTRPAPAPVATEPGFEVPRLTTAREPGERVPLFYIDDTVYTVERSPGVNVSLAYLHLRRTQGEETAIAYLLEKLLGTEGFLALMEYDGLTAEQFQKICQIASDLTVGALEVPKES